RGRLGDRLRARQPGVGSAPRVAAQQERAVAGDRTGYSRAGVGAAVNKIGVRARFPQNSLPAVLRGGNRALTPIFLSSIFLLLSSLAQAQGCGVIDPELRGSYAGPCVNGLAEGRGSAVGTAEYRGE